MITYKPKKVLSMNADSKTVKGVKQGYLTAIQYFAPASQAGGTNLCPNAENAGCESSCLYTAGRGAFNSTQLARINKTKRFLNEFDNYMLDLVHSIKVLERKAARERLIPVVRLNGTSDIDWSVRKLKNGNNLFEEFPHITFYDYTKVPKTVANYPNYSLTFSFSAINSYSKTVKNAKKRGMNMAVVFKGELPQTYLGLPVIDGDNNDLRFLDPTDQQYIIGLKAKGKAKKDTSGFVIDVANI